VKVDNRKKIKKNSYHNIAIKILLKANNPIKLKDLTVQIMAVRRDVKTPEKTISAAIQKSPFIFRTSRARYQLTKSFDRNLLQ